MAFHCTSKTLVFRTAKKHMPPKFTARFFCPHDYESKDMVRRKLNESPWARPQESMARPCETDMSEALTLTVTLSESLNTLKTAKRVRTRPGLEAPMSKGSKASNGIGKQSTKLFCHLLRLLDNPLALANSRLNCSVISSAIWTTQSSLKVHSLVYFPAGRDSSQHFL